MGLVLKYVQEPNDERGMYRYRRRVSKPLQEILGKSELIRTLGSSRDEALRRYPQVHAAFERELTQAHKKLRAVPPNTHNARLTDKDRYDLLIERLRDLGIDDPWSRALDQDESDVRSIMAENIAGKYPTDSDTGEYVGISSDDVALISAIQGVPPVRPVPSLEDGKRLYIAEKVTGSDFEQKKQIQRIERNVDRVEKALGRVPLLSELSRDDAKKVRDYMLSLDLKPSTVKRDLNVLKAIVNHSIREMDLGKIATNPFNGLDIPRLETEETEGDKRDPLPPEVLKAVRAEIMSTAKIELRTIWRLLEGTGCRVAEVAGLRVEDVDVDGECPNVTVQWHEGRRIKNKVSRRQVPLVGDALDAARDALKNAGKGPALFPRYSDHLGPTNVSAALNKQIDKVSDNPKHVVHSLRHNVKDRLILAEVSQLEQHIILGHTQGGVGDTVYGGSTARLKATSKAMKKAFGLGEGGSSA